MIDAHRLSRAQDSEPITAVAWSPDGGSLYTASRSLQQKRWDVSAGSCRRSWKVRSARERTGTHWTPWLSTSG